jgi:hypothetical protein
MRNSSSMRSTCSGRTSTISPIGIAVRQSRIVGSIFVETWPFRHGNRSQTTMSATRASRQHTTHPVWFPPSDRDQRDAAIPRPPQLRSRCRGTTGGPGVPIPVSGKAKPLPARVLTGACIGRTDKIRTCDLYHPKVSWGRGVNSRVDKSYGLWPMAIGGWVIGQTMPFTDKPGHNCFICCRVCAPVRGPP